MREAYNKDDILEIIVDKDGLCSLFVNGEHKGVTFVKFEMDAGDMIPILTTEQFLKDKNGKPIITRFETKLTRESK